MEGWPREGQGCSQRQLIPSDLRSVLQHGPSYAATDELGGNSFLLADPIPRTRAPRTIRVSWAHGIDHQDGKVESEGSESP